jgi:altered-inheritance-of-mitochondria protein 5
MVGRIHGFLGGVLLASSFTYYTREYFRKNQQFISSSLHQSKNIIDNRILSDADINKEPVPVNNYVNTSHRGFAETYKDIWNEEIITMVNWIYSINWYKLGVNVDKQVVELTDRIADVVKKND